MRNLDPAIDELKLAVGGFRESRVMGHYNYGESFPVERFKKSNDGLARFGVEISSGFIGQEQLRIVD